MKTKNYSILSCMHVFLAISSCAHAEKESTINYQSENNQMINSEQLDTATLGAGCFWCVEAAFQQLKGVTSVVSGYSGGSIKNPSYKVVCTGMTGHAEVIQVVYNSSEISYKGILEAFFGSHDPTTLNRQGADQGTQYRSVIFYHTEQQKKIAVEIKNKLNAEKVFPDPVVTEISPFIVFYKAEDYHQNYYNLNGEQSYCRYVIQPKLEKFKKVFKEQLKK